MSKDYWNLVRAQRRAKKDDAQDKLIERTYYKYGSGIQINVMDIRSIFQEGRQAILEGRDLEEQIQASIAKYRQN